MHAELQKIKDAWESRDAAGQASSADAKGLPRNGTDVAKGDDKVRKLADAYVAKNKSEYAGWENIPLEVLVGMVDQHRDNGDDAKQWKVEAWLLHQFEPQNIGGPAEAKVRFPNG